MESPCPEDLAQPFLHLVKETWKERQERLKNTSRSHSKSNSSKGSTTRTLSKPKLQPNTDLWALQYPGKCYLEVVYRAYHDIPSQVHDVRNMFAQQVVDCVRQMMTMTSWRVHQVRVPYHSMVNNTVITREIKFMTSRLFADVEYMNMLKARISKVGVCYVDAAGD